MAHAAPASRRPRLPRGESRASGFRDMSAHLMARWALPVAAGLVYGYWAAANRRSGGPITGWNVLFGFVTAIVFVALYAAVRALAPRLKRELRALLWFAFTGVAFGFLYNQSGHTVLRTVAMALSVAAFVGLALFYWYYTHEDAEGHRIG